MGQSVNGYQYLGIVIQGPEPRSQVRFPMSASPERAASLDYDYVYEHDYDDNYELRLRRKKGERPEGRSPSECRV